MNKLRWGIIYILIIFDIYAMVNFVIVVSKKKSITKCGTILIKSADEIAIKHGSQTELYFLMKFNDGTKKAIKVNETTYFSYNKNERVCFDLKIETNNFKQELIYLLGGMLWIVKIFIILLIIIYFLVTGEYVFKKSKSAE